jgi:hypothetical protein
MLESMFDDGADDPTPEELSSKLWTSVHPYGVDHPKKEMPAPPPIPMTARWLRLAGRRWPTPYRTLSRDVCPVDVA